MFEKLKNKKKNIKKGGNGITNFNRRDFLKLSFFGGVTLVAGKYFGDSLEKLTKRQPRGEIMKEVEFSNFKVYETNKELSFHDSNDEAIFVIDKD